MKEMKRQLKIAWRTNCEILKTSKSLKQKRSYLRKKRKRKMPNSLRFKGSEKKMRSAGCKSSKRKLPEWINSRVNKPICNSKKTSWQRSMMSALRRTRSSL